MMLIELNSKKYGIHYVKVDDEDFEMVKDTRWYLSIVHGIKYAACHKPITSIHRTIMSAKKGEVVDHINGDGLDNRRCNLRLVTRNQNRYNQKLRKNSTTGLKGVMLVYWKEKYRGMYQANITLNSKLQVLGYFDTPQLAAEAYDKRAVELFGEFARTNKMLGLI